MATIKDLAEQYGLEDYQQLLGGYPNATKFVNALQSGIESHIPTTEDLQSPERMGEWSLAAALNQPTGLATKPIKNLNQALLDKYIERGYLPEDELSKYEKNAAKMRNAGRQDINVQNAQANPEYEAYKAEYDVPFMHGTERLDRVLSKEGLDPKRATSGPMLYGTDSPEIASSYAKNKQDTSMMDDEDWDYSKAFTVAPQQLGHRGTIPYTVEQSWNYLDPEVRRDILTKAPRVGYSDLDQWQGDFVLHPEGEGDAIDKSHYDYILKNSRGNPLKAMRDYWLDSGNLFNEEEKMSQLYRLAGYPHEISQEMAPWTKREGVLTGVSRIRNPLDTSNVDELREKVIPALKDAFKNDRSRKKDYGADSWDKNTRYTPKEWVNELEDDLNKGEKSYVWTSIPDKITSELKRLGYNGIYDTGGKSAGADSHQVTIPFNPSQIRSKFAAFDPILKHSPNLLAGTALGSVLLHDDDQGYAQGGEVKALHDKYAEGGSVNTTPISYGFEYDQMANSLGLNNINYGGLNSGSTKTTTDTPKTIDTTPVTSGLSALTDTPIEKASTIDDASPNKTLTPYIDDNGGNPVGYLNTGMMGPKIKDDGRGSVVYGGDGQYHNRFGYGPDGFHDYATEGHAIFNGQMLTLNEYGKAIREYDQTHGLGGFGNSEKYAKGGSVKDLHNKYEESDYGYGNRPDKTKKGLGYFGELERPDGTGVMTEYSIGVPINGKEMDVPTLVPTLTPDEIRLILHMQDGDDMPRSIVHKAIDHAHQRLSEGKPIFATEEDLYAHGGIVDVLHNDAIEQIMKAFMDSMADDEEPSVPAVSIEITTQNTETPRRGKIPKSIAREAKHG